MPAVKLLSVVYSYNLAVFKVGAHLLDIVPADNIMIHSIVFMPLPEQKQPGLPGTWWASDMSGSPMSPLGYRGRGGSV